MNFHMCCKIQRSSEDGATKWCRTEGNGNACAWRLTLTEEWGLLLAPSSPQLQYKHKYIGKACFLGL